MKISSSLSGRNETLKLHDNDEIWDSDRLYSLNTRFLFGEFCYGHATVVETIFAIPFGLAPMFR